VLTWITMDDPACKVLMNARRTKCFDECGSQWIIRLEGPMFCAEFGSQWMIRLEGFDVEFGSQWMIPLQ
jgi:hypothetical protein